MASIKAKHLASVLASKQAEVKDAESIVLKHGNGMSTADVNLQGATVTSWKICGSELLFLSKKAILDQPSKAIRGGIPIVFPQFGPGVLPQHGFARVSKWVHKESTLNRGTGDVTSVFTLTHNEQTLAQWPHKFELKLTIVLKNSSLSQQLSITNKNDEEAFDFTTLLHTYLRVDDIHKATVDGLQGCVYTDKVEDAKDFHQGDRYVRFDGEVDRVYQNVQSDVAVGDGGNCDVLVKKTGFSDVVVWNPWIDKAKAMSDFEDEEYKTMVCVEVGTVAAPITLKAGESWQGAQGLSLRVLERPAGKK